MSPLATSSDDPRKIAVFMPNWIGDAVMATPTLRALRNRFPNAVIHAIQKPYVADVLAGLDLVDDSILADPKSNDHEQRFWSLTARLRRERYDLMVMLTNSLRTAFLAWASRARRRIGVAKEFRGIFLTDSVPQKPKSPPHPAMLEYLRIVAPLGCADEDRTMELALLPDDVQAARQFWALHPKLSGTDYVAFNPGGAFGAAKHWPVSAFGVLAHRIASERNREVVVLCGPSEREQAEKIVHIAGHDRVVSLADVQPSLGLTKAMVANASLLVTTDSGPRHFAPPFGVPVVTLFGPTHKEWSETFVPNATHLQVPVDCGPCQQRVCPLGHHRCMTELTPEMVFEAVSRSLPESTAPARAS